MPGLAGALALVPWGTLIDKAPAIASGAADLYARVRHRQAAIPSAPAADPAARVAAAEARIAELETELQGSAGLIAELAASNASLLAAVERGRRGLIATATVALLALVGATAGLIL